MPNDASEPSDAADASDAGCTAQPGDLPGERMVAAGALLPNLTFATATGSIALVDDHVPCAPRAELIVVRSLAAWSGHSRWHVAHTGRLRAQPERVHVVDLLVEGVDALPARTSDLADFAALYDTAPDALAIDPGETFGALALGGSRLPAVAIIDARTLRLVRLLFVPRAGEVEHAIDVQLATLDHLPPPAPFVPALEDERFSEDEWDLIHAMAYPTSLPADASNALADDDGAAALGAALFADTGMSPAAIACASCHQPAAGFADARPLGHGIADVTRHTPTLYASAFVRWPFWDGRVDSLWAQALGPTENAREMGSSRLFVAHHVQATQRTAYEAVFGAMPDLADAGRFPAAGAPGDATWDAMAAGDQTIVSRIFTNVGKAIEAYERTLAPPHTRFDDYVAGDTTALTATERDGLREYVREGCADCHWGPAMSDSAFHAIGMPGAGEGATLDVGRAAVLATLAGSAFRRTGAFSDDAAAIDPLAGVTALDASTTGAFRTPTLRGLSSTAPYGHAGTFASLRDVVVHYARIRMPRTPDPHVAGGLDEHLVGFDDIAGRVDPLTAFLETL
jgi:cytochrome c peroxidase